jgi:hypothetical protein
MKNSTDDAMDAVAQAVKEIGSGFASKPGLKLAQHELDLKRRNAQALENILEAIQGTNRALWRIVLILAVIGSIVFVVANHIPDFIQLAKR